MRARIEMRSSNRKIASPESFFSFFSRLRLSSNHSCCGGSLMTTSTNLSSPRCSAKSITAQVPHRTTTIPASRAAAVVLPQHQTNSGSSTQCTNCGPVFGKIRVLRKGTLVLRRTPGRSPNQPCARHCWRRTQMTGRTCSCTQSDGGGRAGFFISFATLKKRFVCSRLSKISRAIVAHAKEFGQGENDLSSCTRPTYSKGFGNLA